MAADSPLVLGEGASEAVSPQGEAAAGGDGRPAPNRQVLAWGAIRVSREGAAPLFAEVSEEEPLDIYLNGRLIATLMRLPGDERELAAGFCFSEGLVAGAADLLAISHCGMAPGEAAGIEAGNRVDVKAVESPAAATWWPREIRSGCGRTDVSALDLGAIRGVESSIGVSADALLGLGDTLRRAPRLYTRTGGVHAAALFAGNGDLVVVREDIGRHNAVDKVIGYALLRSMRLDDKVILTTGRASHEMVMKAVRAGAPVLASVSSATSLAVRLAERLNLTLVGYLRGGRATVYTRPDRIVVP